jgi:16S rRNA processing protein RimM
MTLKRAHTKIGPKSAAKICLGVILGAHGIKGEVKIKTFTHDPLAIAAYGALCDAHGKPFRLTAPRIAKGGVIAAIEGVSDRTAAEALTGTELFVARAVLPEPKANEFYHADLIGLEARLKTGDRLGRIAAVHNFGAGDILEIAGGSTASLMVPFRRAAVPRLDLDAGVIEIDWPSLETAANKGRRKAGAKPRNG